jgi:ferric-dicitrate binding protein FerR (iron transport regulator)
MKNDAFISLVESLINGGISADDHDRLQSLLKSDPKARAVFRERMDLEASLRTWAAEDLESVRSVPSSHDQITPSLIRKRARHGSRVWKVSAGAVVVVATLLLVALPWLRPGDRDHQQLASGPTEEQQQDESKSLLVGTIRQQGDCQWADDMKPVSNQFSAGPLSLLSGLVELSFDSGTDIVLEAPCELVVLSADSARLLNGNVCVNVTEVSNGFTLHTPEAAIIDEGTEYAVAINEVSTEVHVFDGSVIWVPETDTAESEDRIEAGEAKLYSRSEPGAPRHIPFGQRQFVRRLETEVKAQAGDSLLAYDGFENLAGRIRRGRSGFGWEDGWQSGRRGRGQLADIVDTPSDVVFGMDLSGRRQLELKTGESIRRTFERPLSLRSGTTYFVSVLIQRVSPEAEGDHWLRLSLEPETTGRHGRRRSGLSFGITSEGFPFINTGQNIEQVATRIHTGKTYLCVMKLADGASSASTMLRLYESGESIDSPEPTVWTVSARAPSLPELHSLILSVGNDALWRIDELRIGTDWSAVPRSSDPN